MPALPRPTPPGALVESLAPLVLRHRLVVVLGWLVLMVAGGIVAGPVTDRLTFDFSLPGQPGYEAEQQLIETFGTSTADTLVPVVTVPEGSTVQERVADIAGVFDAVRAAAPQLRVVDLGSTGDDGFVTDDGRSTFALIQGPEPTGFGAGIQTQVLPAVQQAAAASGLEVGLTSYVLLAAGGDTEGPSVLAETLFGAVGALLVLIFVFA